MHAAVGSYASDTRARAARHADSMAWNNLRAEQLGYDPPVDDGASEGPLGTVRWVRNAIQRSWGAWLAGDSSPGAWQMCRDQATTPADAVFLDVLRDQQAPGGAGAHMPPGSDVRMVDGSVVGSSGGEWGVPTGASSVAMASRNNSRHHSEPLDWGSMENLREHDAPWGCGPQGDALLQNIVEDRPNDAGARQGLPGPSEHASGASLAAEADNALRRLGAVVDDDERLEGDGEEEEEESDEDADDEEYMHAYEMGRRAARRGSHRRNRPRPAAGPELTSYIYGHVRALHGVPCLVARCRRGTAAPGKLNASA